MMSSLKLPASNLLLSLSILLLFIISIVECNSNNINNNNNNQNQWSQASLDLRHYTTTRVTNGDTKAGGGGAAAEPIDVYLESMEDLEHVAHLTMRNFNLTDESLLQSSWLVGLGNSIVHKQHQKVDPLASNEPRGRLDLMLESFIWHLRNGHLKRLSLDELISIGESLNNTQLVVDGNENQLASGQNRSQAINEDIRQQAPIYDDNLSAKSESTIRCHYLVNIYIYELRERHTNQLMVQQQQQQVQQQVAAGGSGESRIEYDNSSSSNMTIEQTSQTADSQQPIDTTRLMRLCRIAVECHSTDDLVNLISGTWRHQEAIISTISSRQTTPETPTPRAKRNGVSSMIDEEFENSESRWIPRDGSSFESRARYPKSLRDSLSTSLAKLCPLMLFQLHDDDGLCSMRRDDRPPMITVWGFATLFVTIVSFCSLIGLSITPLLGQQAAADSSGLSEISEGGDDLAGYINQRPGSPGASGNHHHHQQQQQQHRACLNLFEGLAVGSLVGSALFSLIPQAFELQERESNQGFLLKALIIFFGIYLFFCSERLMRIILDTRQQRKKKKRLQHRSSNLPSTTADFDHHHHMLPFATSQGSSIVGGGGRQAAVNARWQLQQRSSAAPTSASVADSQVIFQNGRKNLANPVSFGSSGGGGSNLSTATATQQQQHQKNQFSCLARLNSLNLRGESRHQQQQQVDVSDQHIEIRKPVGVETTRSVNFQRRKKTQNGKAKQNQQKDSLLLEAESLELEGKQFNANGMNSINEMRGPKPKPKPKTRILSEGRDLLSQQQQAPKHQRHQVVTADGGSKRRKTRQQLQAAKRRRNKRLVEKLVSSTRHNEIDDEIDYNSVEQQQTLCLPTKSSSLQYQSRGESCATIPAALPSRPTMKYSLNSSSSSSSCSSYNSNDDLYNSNLSHRDRYDEGDDVDDDDEDEDEGYFVASKNYRNSRLDARTRSSPQYYCGSKQEELAELEQDSNISPPRASFHHNTKQYGRVVGPHDTGMSQVEQDISTVAWMIILGDGLHNFIDGISIGAAFSESILSGVSISVAVICEEFPHELGDFAILVSSGMTVRQALGYNFLSACTCYLGMAVGIILGDVNDGASYISALAAGVFLYIALVDMMGELSATLEETSRNSIGKTLKLLLLQNVGIFIGISIIFILSFIDF